MQTKESPEQPGTGTDGSMPLSVSGVDGPELMDLALYADTFTGMKLKALDHARRFYGDEAELRIVDMSRIVNADPEEAPGQFYGHVWVLCLNLEERYPLALDEVHL